MAATTNIYGFNVGGNNNSFDQRGHFYRAFLSGNVSGMTVKQNSTPNMTVLVEHGSALLNKNTISASIAEIKSDTSVTIDTANTSNPRIDTVVIYEDTSVAIPTVEGSYWQDGAGGRFKLVSLPGTAGAVPVALSDANIQSAIGAGKPWARLANITVPANSTTIINSNINNSVRSKLGVPLANINGGSTAGVLTTDASGVVTAVALSSATDANDWLVHDYGAFKIATKTLSSNFSKVRFELGHQSSNNLPVGVSNIAGLKSYWVTVGGGDYSDYISLTRQNNDSSASSLLQVYLFLGPTSVTTYTVPITFTVIF